MKILVLLLFAIVGWMICGAIMGFGRELFDMQTTLILHAIGAPVAFALLSLWYFRIKHSLHPFIAAVGFITVVIVLDLFVVALMIEKSFDMFRSFVGTWLPFMLVFISVFSVGLYIKEAGSEALPDTD
jgi:hypothetical protein